MIMERKCANCANGTWCDGKNPITDVCIQCRYVDVNDRPQPSNWKPHPMTNGDRIRAMTDDELAKFIPDWSYTNACKCDEQPYVDCNNECEKCVAEWLKQTAEDE